MNTRSTLESSMKSLFSYIIENAPEGMTEGNKRLLQKHNVDYCAIDFIRRSKSNPESDLRVSFSLNFFEVTYESAKDDEGNLWKRCRPIITINWPSWGEMNIDLASERISYMSEVLAFASSIKDKFPTLWVLYETVEEKAKHTAFQADLALRKVIINLSRGMGKGKSRHVKRESIELDRAISVGNYELTIGTRKFTVTLDENQLHVTRTE